MATGRVRASKLADLIAQFGDLNPVGGAIEAGVKGFQAGQSIKEKAQLAVQRAEEIKKAKFEQQQAEEKKTDISRRAEIATNLAFPGQTPTGSQIAPTGTTLRKPLPEGVQGPVQEIPIAAPRPETLEDDPELQTQLLREQTEIEQRQFPEKFVGGDTAELRGRDIQQFFLVSPDGDRNLVSFVETAEGGRGKLFDAITGTPISDEERKELGKQGFKLSRATPQLIRDAAGNIIPIDPNIGRRDFEIKTGATPIRPDQIGTVTQINSPLIARIDRKEIIQETTAVKRNAVIKSALKMLPQLDNVEDFLAQDNEVAVDRMGGLVQKMIALDVGNLAAWEQRDPNSRAFIRKLRQWASLQLSGKLITDTKEDMVEVLQITRNNLSTNIDDIAGITKDNLIALFPQLDPKFVDKLMGLENFSKKLLGKPGGEGFTTSSGIKVTFE